MSFQRVCEGNAHRAGKFSEAPSRRLLARENLQAKKRAARPWRRSVYSRDKAHHKARCKRSPSLTAFLHTAKRLIVSINFKTGAILALGSSTITSLPGLSNFSRPPSPGLGGAAFPSEHPLARVASRMQQSQTLHGWQTQHPSRNPRGARTAQAGRIVPSHVSLQLRFCAGMPGEDLRASAPAGRGGSPRRGAGRPAHALAREWDHERRHVPRCAMGTRAASENVEDQTVCGGELVISRTGGGWRLQCAAPHCAPPATGPELLQRAVLGRGFTLELNALNEARPSQHAAPSVVQVPRSAVAACGATVFALCWQARARAAPLRHGGDLMNLVVLFCPLTGLSQLPQLYAWPGPGFSDTELWSNRTFSILRMLWILIFGRRPVGTGWRHARRGSVAVAVERSFGRAVIGNAGLSLVVF